MRRVICLWLPRWPIDRQQELDCAPDRPFVLALSVGNQRLVSAANAAAEALGIVPGLPLSDARALHPGLAVTEADLAGDMSALRHLARWCNRYSPWTVPHGADSIFLDITGCAHLRGDEARLIRDLVERLESRGIACRAALADTAGAAWAVAHCGNSESAVVPPGAARLALALLPVAALRLDSVLAGTLERLGLRHIGDLYALPRAALAARFGDKMVERLDQALDAAAEPLSPMQSEPMRWTQCRFAEPISTPEALGAATRMLIQRLCRALDDEMLGARRLMLSSYRVDGKMAQVAVGTTQPSRDPRHLFRLFAERLSAIDPGLGIEDMRLMAPVVERRAAAQLCFALPHRARSEASERRGSVRETTEAGGKILRFPGRSVTRQVARALLPAEGRDNKGADAAELAILVDRLANRLGVYAVGTFVLRESHVPERAQHFVPVFASAKGGGRSDRPRPVRLLPRPEPIEVTAPVPDDPPIFFHWRSLWHQVRRADGPERICGEWWCGNEEASRLRDYYRVEDETGRRFWLYRDGLYRPQAATRWFLHGLFA